LLDGGTGCRRLVILTDVSAVVEREEGLRRSGSAAAVARLAAGVAHDFNNILQVVMGRAALAESAESVSDDQRRHLSEINQACTRAATVVRQLRAFSRTVRAQPRTLDLVEVIEGIRRPLSHLLGNSASLEIVIGADTPHVHADPALIEQIVLNLGLAVRDTLGEQGKVRLISCRYTPDAEFRAQHPFVLAGDYGQIMMSDSGPSMDDSAARLLFDPMLSGTESGSTVGLGLATAYNAAKQLGGYVIADAAAGDTGGAFRILLPVAATEMLPGAVSLR
jgi:signal transduction histidine kinase